MKRNVHLGFALMLILLCSGYAYSQNGLKSNTIIIEKNDTVINGKKLSELSKSERDKFRSELKDIGEKLGDNNKLEIKGTGLIVEHNSRNPSRVISLGNGDSTMVRFRFNESGPLTAMNVDPMIQERPLARTQRLIMDDAFSLRSGFERSNSQSFNFSNTDKDGISTRVNITVSEPDKQELNRLVKSSAAENKPEVKDLMLYPNFSSGNIAVSFNLATKGNAEVKLADNDTKVLFTEKFAGGTFLKQVSMPKNGIYYLTIRQGDTWFVKKIIKQ